MTFGYFLVGFLFVCIFCVCSVDGLVRKRGWTGAGAELGVDFLGAGVAKKMKKTKTPEEKLKRKEKKKAKKEKRAAKQKAKLEAKAKNSDGNVRKEVKDGKKDMTEEGKKDKTKLKDDNHRPNSNAPTLPGV